MSGAHAILRASVLVLAALHLCACHKINPAPPETPAPPQPAGREFVYSFDNDAPGKIAASFHSALTGGGSKSEWVVKTDTTAPSQANVLAQMSADDTGYRFPLAIADEGAFQNLEMSVKFKPVSGSEDQAAGLVWRLKDANNYYIVRANALENNVNIYKYENGNRRVIKEGNAPVASGQWQELRVEAVSHGFRAYLNGELVAEAADATYAAGPVGLWTKADSVTCFDDVEARPL